MIDFTNPEVRYQMLRPRQIVERREACPIVYIPLGNLEWHGVQNPLGADTLQAEGIAIRAAQKGGGLVFPPLWYYAPDHEMTGWIPNNREAIAGEMRQPAELFEYDGSDAGVRAASLEYQRRLVDLLGFAETLGFQVGVLVPGHYPLIGHAMIAAHQFAMTRFMNYTRRQSGKLSLLPWAGCEPNLRTQLDGVQAGDHGGGWETSNVMALHPQTVDLSLLPPVGEPLIGIGGHIPPQEATAEQGEANIEAASELFLQEARHRLEHPTWYQHPSYLMQQGLWRAERE